MRFFEGKMSSQRKKGFTLIEALVLLVIFSILTISFYNLYTLVLVNIIESKKRLVAVEIASQELETFRNTPYVDIALGATPTPPVGSVSGGGLIYDEVITVGSNDYRVLREVYFVDDPEDNEGSGDTAPQDYKSVIVSAFWGGGILDTSVTDQRVKLSSHFVPPRGNELGITDGIVSINVIDSDGVSLAGIFVSIEDLTPSSSFVTQSTTTDTNGNAIFGGIPESPTTVSGAKNYRIVVGNGVDAYETVTTLAEGANFFPIYDDVTVIPGTVSTRTIVIDLEPDFALKAVDPYCQNVGVVNFDIVGGRVIGSDLPGDPVYINTDAGPLSVATDSNGDLLMNTVTGYVPSPGRYTVSNIVKSGYTFWKMSPGDDVDRFATHASVDASISPIDDEFDCGMIFLDNSADSVFVTVLDADALAPISGAHVRLQNVTLGYNEEAITDLYGKVYFPVNQSVPLVNGGEYTIRVAVGDYEDDVSTVTVTGLEEVQITLSE